MTTIITIREIKFVFKKDASQNEKYLKIITFLLYKLVCSLRYQSSRLFCSHDVGYFIWIHSNFPIDWNHG